MDLDDVRIFTKVAELGSFTKASKQLRIPKSTVSRRVAELEERLGVRLLQRSTRKLTLTHGGELYFNRTSRAILDLEQAERALDEMQSQPRGVLRITTPSDMSGIVPRLVGDFQKQYPLVQVIVFSTGRRVDLIAEGYDLALRAGSRIDSTLISKKLLESRLGLFASPEYLEKHGAIDCPAQLSEHNCLGFGTERLSNTWTLVRGQHVEEVTLSGSLASNDFGLLLSACLQGLGVSLLPLFQTGRLTQAGRLVRLLSDWDSELSGLYVVYPSPRHLSPKVRAFIDFSSSWLKESTNIQEPQLIASDP